MQKHLQTGSITVSGKIYTWKLDRQQAMLFVYRTAEEIIKVKYESDGKNELTADIKREIQNYGNQSAGGNSVVIYDDFMGT